MSTMAWEVYNEALAPYHMWLIRKGVGVAMYALPTKQNLYEKSGLTSEEEGNQLMLEAAQSMEPVYNSVQKLYEEYDLLELPWIIFGGIIETVSPEGTFCDTVQVPSSAGDIELN